MELCSLACVASADVSIHKSKDSNYVIQTLMGDTVVVAPKFLDELKMLPESKLSPTAAFVDSWMGEYTGVDFLLRDRLTYDICRNALTRNLGELPLFRRWTFDFLVIIG